MERYSLLDANLSDELLQYAVCRAVTGQSCQCLYAAIPLNQGESFPSEEDGYRYLHFVACLDGALDEPCRFALLHDIVAPQCRHVGVAQPCITTKEERIYYNAVPLTLNT